MHLPSSVPLIAILGAGAAPALAKVPEPDADATITVTASRTGAAIRDPPICGSVLDSDALARQFGQPTDIRRAPDLTVPGLNLSTGDRSRCLTTIRGHTPSLLRCHATAMQEWSCRTRCAFA